MEDVPSSDFANLRKIVPPEVWTLIAGKLLKTGSEDLENLANSSAFFQDLLASQRTTYLFEKVFPLVASSVWKSEEGLEGMPVSEVLKLRGVCSHWNAVIDKLIVEKFLVFGEGSQERSIIRNRTAQAFKSSTDEWFCHLTDMGEVDKTIYSFLSHFEPTHPGLAIANQSNGRSPFTSGYVFVVTSHNDRDEEYDQFLDGVTTMLTKYGSHIQEFTLYLDCSEFVDLENATMFQKWFAQMANLKELRFTAEIGMDNWEEYLNTLIPGWEFPRFQFLEKLTTEYLHVTLFNPLIRQNSHISALIVESILDDYDFFTFPLPNLRCLEMGSISVKHLEKMSSPEVQWPLEKLSIKFSEDLVGCAALFKVLEEKFSRTLVSLEIVMVGNGEEDDGPRWQDMNNCRLQLPELKKIKLFTREDKVSLDFMLGLKHNLEEISVQVGYFLPRQIGTWTGGTIVQFMGFQGKMLKSNIWVLFKKLKKIEVRAKWGGNNSESKWYYRDEWMVNNEYGN